MVAEMEIESLVEQLFAARAAESADECASAAASFQ
jgi:hypothetical protein